MRGDNEGEGLKSGSHPVSGGQWRAQNFHLGGAKILLDLTFKKKIFC